MTRADDERTGSDYGALMREVRRTRLLDRSFAGYAPRLVALVAAAAAGAGAAWWLGPSWWQLAVAGWFALLFGQIGFVAHDAGHQQVFRSRRHNDRFGRALASLGIGLGYGWWVDKHTRHHQRPNDVDVDPDVQRNVLAWTPAQARQQTGVLGLVARHQAALFVPLLMLEAVNIHVSSVRAVLEAPRRRRLDLVLLAAHFATYLGLVFWFLPPGLAVAFVAVHQAVLGLYLGASFAPNHKGMLMPGAGDDLDFLRRQVLTSRNVRGGRLLAAGLGALNLQVEHHLFPSMPSRNLRRVQPLVRRFCADHDIAYCETGLVDSYRRGLRHLSSVAPSRVRAAGAPGVVAP